MPTLMAPIPEPEYIPDNERFDERNLNDRTPSQFCLQCPGCGGRRTAYYQYSHGWAWVCLECRLKFLRSEV